MMDYLSHDELIRDQQQQMRLTAAEDRVARDLRHGRRLRRRLGSQLIRAGEWLVGSPADCLPTLKPAHVHGGPDPAC